MSNQNTNIDEKELSVTEKHTSIKYWSNDEQPREKMIQKGQSALSDAELIAILFQSGTAKKSAIDIAREVLARAKNDLNLLSRSSLQEFQKTKGVGIAKAVKLAAALELGRRRQMSEVLKKEKFNSSKDVASFLIPLLRDKPNEVFCVLYLNNAGKLIHHELISFGGITSTVVDIKIILKNAIQLLASAIIVAHNHPSGNRSPSKSDRELTAKLKNATKLVDLKLLDHIIIAENDYFSFVDENLL